MAITDLTGTTWRINEVPVVSQSLQPTIFYTANNSDYVAFVCIPTSPGNYQITYATQTGSSEPDVIAYNTTTGGWNTTGGADYRTIVISENQHGQTGVTNSAFIAWLEANAVQVIPPVTISYNGNTIATIDTSGTEILDTADTYMIDDISIEYTAPTPSLQAKTNIIPTTSSQTITADSGYDGLLSVQINGDANLVTGNIKNGVSIFNVTGTYEGSGGGDSDELITRTISQYSGSASIIGLYAFYSCSNLTTVSCLNCTSISNSAFFGCSNLTTVSFPNCTTVGSYAFANCTNLTTISFPSCTGIRAYAFSYCNHLTSAVFPNCTVISHYAFYSCSNLATISFPKCSYLGSNAFSGCYSLTAALFPECSSIWNNAFYSCSHLLTISFPKCLSVGSNAFYGCASLTEAIFPKSRNIGNSAFYNCISLATASFPSCSSIGPSAFTRCMHLLSLYLLTSSVPTLSAVAVFSLTPISGYTAQTGGVHGSIFVKESLLASFKAATNWSVYSARMVGLTDAQIAALG